MKGAWCFRTRKMKSPKSRYMSIYKSEYDECIDLVLEALVVYWRTTVYLNFFMFGIVVLEGNRVKVR